MNALRDSMLRWSLVLGLLCAAPGAGAADRLVAQLQDPAGDDDGDGALIYPQRADFQRGDLDLVSLRIVQAGEGGYRFEATFSNPVRSPVGVMADVGGESLAEFARRGFYAFNLDIYIDQDRVAGSGNTHTLPGRHASLDPAYAWERAVILTPRPELTRQQLIDAIAQDEGQEDRRVVAQRVDAAICFPTAIAVRGRSVSFTVPAAFLATGGADADWAITALVTGAKTTTETDLNLLRSPGAALARIPIGDLPLGVMQPVSGRPRDTFGYSTLRAPLPIVDLLAPPPVRHLVRAPAADALPKAAVVPSADRNDIKKRGDPAAADPVAERLRRLKRLHDEGLLSDEEYAQLRSKVLAGL